MNISHAIIAQADLLAERHVNYVSDFVTRANSELYAILAEILKLHEQLEGSKQRDKLIKLMRKNLRENYQIKTQTNTSTTALVTKYVTRASRKTAHVYSRVLQVAIANGVTSANLVDFIVEKGGIDRVRMAVATAEAVKDAKALAKLRQQKVRSQLNLKDSIGRLDLGSRTRALPCASDVDFYHFLGRFNMETKAHEVVAVMYPSSSLEAQAIDQYMLMLGLAAASDDNTFYEQCKSFGVNMDILLTWMAANNIANADAARDMARLLSRKQLLCT